MEHFTVEGWEPKTPDSISLPVSEDGYIHVSTVDEFLAAIGPSTSIYLEDGVYDLSTASSYGAATAASTTCGRTPGWTAPSWSSAISGA